VTLPPSGAGGDRVSV